MKKNNKKGSIRDLFFLIALIFFLSISFFVAYRTYDSVKTQLIDNSPIGNDTKAVEALNSVSDVIDKVDYFFMLGFIFTVIGMLISSFLVDFHPIFYLIYVLSWILAVMIAAVISVVYDKMIVYSYFSNFDTIMPFATFIFNHLPVIITVVGFLLAGIMFIRIRSGQYTQR